MPLHIDKVAHVAEYAILTLLVCRAVRTPTRRALILIAFSCTIYGIIDELHQHLIPGRFPSIWDAAADAIGCALTATVWHVRILSRRDQEGTETQENRWDT
jgi:VanZ family protein